MQMTRIKSVLFLAILVCLLSELGPVALRIYEERQDFQDKLADIAGKASLQRWNDHVILRLVKTWAQSKGFEVSDEDIVIQRVPGRVEVTLVVRYRRMEVLPGGFEYLFTFTSMVRGVDSL